MEECPTLNPLLSGNGSGETNSLNNINPLNNINDHWLYSHPALRPFPVISDIVPSGSPPLSRASSPTRPNAVDLQQQQQQQQNAKEQKEKSEDLLVSIKQVNVGGNGISKRNSPRPLVELEVEQEIEN